MSASEQPYDKRLLLSQEVGAWLRAELQDYPMSSPIYLAFSGGLDSTVLLHCLCQFPNLKSRLTLLHVHHGLSVHADRWQQHCQQQAKQYALPIVCQRVVVDAKAHGIEAAARQARYEAFTQQIGDEGVLLTAHHADDQLETFLQRWLRGSGLQGLGAMRVRRPLVSKPALNAAMVSHALSPCLLRPLLSHSRSTLELYAQQHRLVWIHDESNDDQRWTRNWWRHELLPRIWARYPQQKMAALRSIEQLQHDQQVLTHLLQPYVAQVMRSVTWPNTACWALDLRSLYALDKVLQPYVLRAWWQHVQLPSLSQRLLLQWLQQLQAENDRQPSWPLADGVLQRHQHMCYWYRPVTKIPERVRLTRQDDIPWAGGTVRYRHSGDTPTEEYYLVAAESITERSLRPYQRPRKTFKQIFQEHQIPPWLRSAWPVLVDENGQVVSVVGLAVDHATQQHQPLVSHYDWQP
ncbi:MAG: tRNA lysidine(34) synthetase TilS [Bacterioplanes sp.]|nr:tRNA lysidine(34) synthetase TilS [Bacterioplanes sp.]